jgi:hypothetical protein
VDATIDRDVLARMKQFATVRGAAGHAFKMHFTLSLKAPGFNPCT